MKLYESYFQIEQLWMKVEDILTGEITEGPDGLPVDAELALDWIEEALSKIEDERDEKQRHGYQLSSGHPGPPDAEVAPVARLDGG